MCVRDSFWVLTECAVCILLYFIVVFVVVVVVVVVVLVVGAEF